MWYSSRGMSCVCLIGGFEVAYRRLRGSACLPLMAPVEYYVIRNIRYTCHHEQSRGVADDYCSNSSCVPGTQHATIPSLSVPPRHQLAALTSWDTKSLLFWVMKYTLRVARWGSHIFEDSHNCHCTTRHNIYNCCRECACMATWGRAEGDTASSVPVITFII
jgi:hypothetical protein